METATIVLYPSPGIGHLVSMVELGKLIITHHPSLSVVIFITPAPYETGDTAKYIAGVSATAPSITFHHLPTLIFPPNYSSDFIDLAFGIPELQNPTVHETLISISEKSTIKAVVLDFFSNAAFNVSKNLEIPTYFFYTSGASGLCAFLYIVTIHNTTSGNIRDMNNYFEIPGVPMVAWPLYAEQRTNRLYLVEEIKVVLPMKMSADGFVTAGAVEEKVRELMEGGGGREVRRQMSVMSSRAKAAVADGGSSYVALSKLMMAWAAS